MVSGAPATSFQRQLVWNEENSVVLCGPIVVWCLEVDWISVESSFVSPPTTQSVKGLNWNERFLGSARRSQRLCTAFDGGEQVGGVRRGVVRRGVCAGCSVRKLLQAGGQHRKDKDCMTACWWCSYFVLFCGKSAQFVFRFTPFLYKLRWQTCYTCDCLQSLRRCREIISVYSLMFQW